MPGDFLGLIFLEVRQGSMWKTVGKKLIFKYMHAALNWGCTWKSNLDFEMTLNSFNAACHLQFKRTTSYLALW